MKNFKLILATLALAFAFVSCNDDGGLKEPDPVIPATAISFQEAEVTVEVGKSVELSVIITPEDANADDYFQTSSSNTDVAGVQGIVVTGVAEGTATITATTVKGLTANCTVTVIPRKYEKPDTSNWPASTDVEISDTAMCSAIYFSDYFGAAQAGVDISYTTWIIGLMDSDLVQANKGYELDIYVIGRGNETALHEGIYSIAYGVKIESLLDLLVDGTMLPYLQFQDGSTLGSAYMLIDATGAEPTVGDANVVQAGWLDVKKDGANYILEFELLSVNGEGTNETLKGTYTGAIEFYNGDEMYQ